MAYRGQHSQYTYISYVCVFVDRLEYVRVCVAQIAAKREGVAIGGGLHAAGNWLAWLWGT